MQYFVTGASGFIGKRLVQQLLKRRGAVVYFLLRTQSADKLAELYRFWGLHGARAQRRAQPVYGELTARNLGLDAAQQKALRGGIDHFFHLAAVYDLKADAAQQEAANVEGTRHALELARSIEAGHFHHMSSIAAAGLYKGTFSEAMFDEAQDYQHPYFHSKHASEALVREERALPWTVYRPAMVVGDSRTGEMDKVDGPYYFFKPIQRLRQLLPPWMPTLGLEGGRINLVPVDYVVAAMDVISHKPGIAGQCYHLVDPQGNRVGEVLDIFCQAAHAPRMNVAVNAGLLDVLPRGLRRNLLALPPLRDALDGLLRDWGLPEGMLEFINYPTRFDSSAAQAMLAGSGVTCPPLKDYAWRLWDYWERHLDTDLHVERNLRGTVAGKVVLITGGSSGIGLAAAHRFAQAGATTIICGRDEDKLQAACAEAEAQGHAFIAYSVDVADLADCDAFVQVLQDEHGGVDFLINNAGRSIRRAIDAAYTRFHDYERTMQLNYFGCLRLTTGLLPSMVARGGGHVVNISSIGVLTNAPRYSAYVASKAALDAWTRCAASEFADKKVSFTTINMPLVRTPMIAPTRLYQNVPALEPQQAADMVMRACIDKPVRIATPLGIAGQLLHAVVPRLAQRAMNTSFRLFADSGKGGSGQLTAQAQAFLQLLRGIYF